MWWIIILLFIYATSISALTVNCRDKNTPSSSCCYGEITLDPTMTEIGDGAFADCVYLSNSLIIPNSVTRIGDYAFHNCYGFSGSLAIPNSVTHIGDYAFNGCYGFTGSLTISNSVTTLGEFAFYGCAGFVGSLTIPNSVSHIGDYAFHGCVGFDDSLAIPNSVTHIGDGAFYSCGFTGSLTIPNSVTYIGDGAFSYCHGFTGPLTIPNSVTYIGDYGFFYCDGFSGSLAVPNSVTHIGDYAFNGCDGFTGSLNISNSVAHIGDYAFYNCHFNGLLTIPNSVTDIGDYAFAYCYGFTSAYTFPDSVTNQGVDIFFANKCNWLTCCHDCTLSGIKMCYCDNACQGACMNDYLPLQPSVSPTLKSSANPTYRPSLKPTYQPSIKPTRKPTVLPTSKPSGIPTSEPTTFKCSAMTNEENSLSFADRTSPITPESITYIVFNVSIQIVLDESESEDIAMFLSSLFQQNISTNFNVALTSDLVRELNRDNVVWRLSDRSSPCVVFKEECEISSELVQEDLLHSLTTLSIYPFLNGPNYGTTLLSSCVEDIGGVCPVGELSNTQSVESFENQDNNYLYVVNFPVILSATDYGPNSAEQEFVESYVTNFFQKLVAEELLSLTNFHKAFYLTTGSLLKTNNSLTPIFVGSVYSKLSSQSHSHSEDAIISNLFLIIGACVVGLFVLGIAIVVSRLLYVKKKNQNAEFLSVSIHETSNVIEIVNVVSEK